MKYIDNRIDIITMGCSKNLVDSERLIKRFSSIGYEVYHDSHNVCGEIVVVNTCGFIGDAKEESINMILELIDAKKDGRINKIFVMGCLSERYLSELKEELPEVDKFYGKFDWENIINEIKIIDKIKPIKTWERTLTTPSYSAYLKISEGCNRFCAYCAIPLITGRHKSRSIDEIIEEVSYLVRTGVKEFNIIAQDLSYYGIDLYGKKSLAKLVEEIAQIKGVEWIRLHYAYPVDFPYDLLEVMAKYPNVCKYLDIALQHISDNVLDNMRRHIDKKATIELINHIRSKVPEIKLRTTLMVGFPGEGENEFNELLDFVRETKFERMGAFAYCEEDDTWAAKHLDDNISQEEKDRRLETLMNLQEEISLEIHENMIGKTVCMIVDRVENNKFIGRSQWDSPEVDPEIHVPFNSISRDKQNNINIGDFINIKITKAYPYELEGILQ